ncbi:MAG: BamA/TamA family outer membrane protein, partial [Myxococcota bacterium]
GLEFPFHSDFVQFDIPQLFDRRLRLTGEVAFRKFSNAGYHGFGSRSQRVEAGSDATEAERNFHTYDRIYPSITANARWQLIDRPVEVGKWRLEVFGGTRLMYNAFNIYESSLLERDVLRVRSSDPASETLRDLLLGTNDHFLWLLNAGFLFDTRDQEFAPTRGTFSELSGRFSPGVDADLVYGGVTLSTSWFASLYRDYLVLAGRFVFDAQFGNVPFYEQTFFGTFSPQDGPAGGGAVRGVVRQRFAGRVKTVGNLELRSQLLPFELFGAKFNVGLTAFFDAGRVWADFETRTLDGENLDDPFLTFEAGTGGGLRLRWGQTFIIRADFAYSPTQDTTGLYIDVGHIF